MATGTDGIDKALAEAEKFIQQMTQDGINLTEFVQVQHFQLQMAQAKAETSKQVADAIAAAAR